MKSRCRIAAACGAMALMLAPAQLPGFTHFLRYVARDGALVAVPERFDLASLPGRVVPYTIAKAGPDALAEGDSFPALMSQIQAAAEVWNGVGTSQLRLRFAGLQAPETAMKTPHVEIVFDEVPPGLVAMGGPVTRGQLVERQDERFFPIEKSRLVLPKDLSNPARPSSSERLFLTLVHELGHTIGLQHSWASSVMSTEITRATTKGAALGDDDRASVSALYPVAGYEAGSGTVTGRVTLDGAGVHLASVVALTPTGQAVSALTKIDGTYRITGLARGEYFVYAQPLPPSLQGEPQPVNLELPVGPNGAIAPGAWFNTVFYPGTERAETKVAVEPGKVAENINFAVTKRDSVNIHSVQTYSFIGREAQKPAVMWPWQAEGQIVLFGYGLSTGQAPVDGLSASVVGGVEPVKSVQAYSASPVYLDLRVGLTPEVTPGVRHLRFQVGGERHITPGAYRVARIQPPVISAATRNEDGTYTLEGERLTAATQIRFDGAAGAVLDARDGKLIVRAPASLPGHHAVVTAYDGEGQSSLMVVGNGSPRVDSTATAAPQFKLSDTWLEPGVETIVEITGENVNFLNDSAKLGFGTSDVIVKKIWALESGKALAWVITAPNAPAATHAAMLNSGLAYSNQDSALQITDGASRRPYVVMSAIRQPAETYSGVDVVLPLGNLGTEIAAGSVSVTISDRAAQVVSAEGSSVKVKIPDGLRAGLQRVSVNMGGQLLLPAVVEIIDPPPAIVKAQTVFGQEVTEHNAPVPGGMLQLIVRDLGDGQIDVGDVLIKSGGTTHTAVQVTATGERRTKLVVFTLAPETLPGAKASLTVTWNGRTSMPFELPVR